MHALDYECHLPESGRTPSFSAVDLCLCFSDFRRAKVDFRLTAASIALARKAQAHLHGGAVVALTPSAPRAFDACHNCAKQVTGGVMLVTLLPLALGLPLHGLLHQTKTGGRLCDDVDQFRGYYKLRTGPGSKNYFYWHFASRHNPESAPTVLWLTGGPGCSSEVALFGENGPCKVNSDGTGTVRNQYGWNEHANLVYVDQPTGTGFSYGTGFDHDEKGVANDMYDFLQQFFEAVSARLR